MMMALRLGDADVHVWRAALDLPPDRVAALGASLAPDERDRAARFHFERDRRRYTVGRGVLRALLGEYLGVAPARLTFAYGAQGKPALATDGDGIRFNVSHTGATALYAVTRDREIGVDVEGLRPDFATDEIAERFFSMAERQALRALSPAERCRAFFSCWTRKEAYIKARGEGLSLPLDGFDVSLSPGEPAALLATRPVAEEAGRWTLENLDAGPGAAAALAVEGRGWRLTRREWPPDRSGAD
jgi:4'-phosphopantetheinyl transferase